MFRIYLAAIDIVPAAIVLTPLFLTLFFTVYKRNIQKTVLYFLFCLYLCAIFVLVGIPNVLYFRPEVNWNLIPFRGIVADLKNSLLNVALFVPLGCFLPLLWARFRRMGRAVAAGFFLSLAIELLQMLTFRATDVNDLITNTLGTAVGYFLAKQLAGHIPPVSENRGEPYYLLAVSFSVIFFIQPFLLPMLWG